MGYSFKESKVVWTPCSNLTSSTKVARNLEIYNHKKSFTKCNMSLYGFSFKVTSRYKLSRKKNVHMGYFSIVHCPTSIPILNRTGKYCCSLFLLCFVVLIERSIEILMFPPTKRIRGNDFQLPLEMIWVIKS